MGECTLSFFVCDPRIFLQRRMTDVKTRHIRKTLQVASTISMFATCGRLSSSDLVLGMSLPSRVFAIQERKCGRELKSSLDVLTGRACFKENLL
jgi:hypothetical protein